VTVGFTVCDRLSNTSMMWKLSHFTLMLVFGDGVLRPHHVGRGCWEFKNRLASFMIIAPFSQADREHVNTAQVVELVLENLHDTIRNVSIAVEWFVKTVPNIVHVHLGYSRVCAWLVPRCMMEIHKNLCLVVLFHFFSHLKEEQTGSHNPWWHCETWVHHFTQNEL